MTATGDALADLQWNWEGAYQIAGSADRWVARRADDGRLLVASNPEELRGLLIEDYTAHPVPRDTPL